MVPLNWLFKKAKQSKEKRVLNCLISVMASLRDSLDKTKEQKLALRLKTNVHIQSKFPLKSRLTCLF